MKAKVVFPAVGNESQWRPSKFDPAKRQCTIVVEADGKTYALYATEGTAAWTAAKGAEIDIETVSEPEQPGKHGFAKLQRQGGSGGGFKSYERRKFTRPTKEEAGAAADYITDLFHAIKGRIKDTDDMTIAALTVATYNKTC